MIDRAGILPRGGDRRAIALRDAFGPVAGRQREHRIDGGRAAEWIAAVVQWLAAQPNVTLLARSTAFGCYDGNLVGLLDPRAASGLAVGDVVDAKARGARDRESRSPRGARCAPALHGPPGNGW